MDQSARPRGRRVEFGRRRVAPRVCIIDRKPYIRTFLAETFEELGFIPEGCADAKELAFRLSASKREWSSWMTPAMRSHATLEPCSEKKLTSFSTSVIFGTFRSVTGASVRSVAQRTGRTEFLLPDGVMVPLRGLPP